MDGCALQFVNMPVHGSRSNQPSSLGIYCTRVESPLVQDVLNNIGFERRTKKEEEEKEAKEEPERCNQPGEQVRGGRGNTSRDKSQGVGHGRRALSHIRDHSCTAQHLCLLNVPPSSHQHYHHQDKE